MKRSLFETCLGALVIIAALAFLNYSYKTSGHTVSSDHYLLHANFSSVGSLRPGADVLVSGVKVGTVQAITLNPETFLATVSMEIKSSLALPLDTAATINSESLLGGLYLALEPGADEESFEDGGEIEFTQSPQNLEQLLGKFIFSLDSNTDGAE